MRPPKMTAGSVCLWLSRLLLGVWICFNFVGASERLSHTGTVSRKHMSGVYRLEWKAYIVCCSDFSPAGCTSI
jgi:hypothetical protein